MKMRKPVFLILLIPLLLVSCTLRKREERSDPPADAPAASSDGYKPPASPLVLAPPEEKPAPQEISHTDGFTLFCAGGGVRSFAIQGAVEVLEEAKVPLPAAVGWGSGAVFAAAYAASSGAHEFEWRLQKLNEAVFSSQSGGGGLARWIGAGGIDKARESAIRKVLGDTEFSGLRKKLWILTAEGARNEGKVADAVLDSLKSPPTSVETEQWARNSGMPALLIETGDASAHGEVGVRVMPSLSGVSEDDFSKRGIAAYRGKLAAKESLPRILERLK